MEYKGLNKKPSKKRLKLKKCKFCGKKYQPNRPWQKFCCPEHKHKYWKKLRSDRRFLLREVVKEDISKIRKLLK